MSKNNSASLHCITFVQRWTNVEDVGPTSYKCYGMMIWDAICCAHVSNVVSCIQSLLISWLYHVYVNMWKVTDRLLRLFSVFSIPVKVLYMIFHSKCDILILCLLNVGSPSAMLSQHWINIESIMYRVCWSGLCWPFVCYHGYRCGERRRCRSSTLWVLPGAALSQCQVITASIITASG